jgi:chromatin remodeling complex protein RSC6
MAGDALKKPLTPSTHLAAVVGSDPIARGDVVSKMWEYIKAKGLQNPANKREIIADEKLKPIFHGEDKVTMFDMNKHLAKHLS